MVRRILDLTLTAIIVAAAINVAYLCWRDSYDFHIGPMHFVSHGFFKPMLILNTAFFLCVLTRRPVKERPAEGTPRWFWPLLVAVVVFWFAVGLPVNARFDEWNYRGFSMTREGWRGFAELFRTAQWGAWYRPAGFASLWIDSRIFGDSQWGYHLQNAALHLANCAILFLLAKRWGWSGMAAANAALLYAGAACVFEPLMWPSARFDLLAMAFMGAALLLAMDYFERGGTGRLAGMLAMFSLAALSKESGYAFTLLLPLVCWRAKTDPRRAKLAVGLTWALAAGLFVMRWKLLGGLGGYVMTSGTSQHLRFNVGTLEGLFAKLFSLSLLIVNQEAEVPGLVRIAVTIMACLLVAAVASGATVTRKHRIAALYALLCGAPVLALLAWLSPAAQDSRYLYMPAAFVMMVTASALDNARWGQAFVLTCLVMNLVAGAHNVRVYGDTYARLDAAAERIEREAPSQGSGKVRVLNLSPNLDGVFFSQSQVQEHVAAKRPDLKLEFVGAKQGGFLAACGDEACYAWDENAHALQRVRD